jgi:hypothetical protein
MNADDNSKLSGMKTLGIVILVITALCLPACSFSPELPDKKVPNQATPSLPNLKSRE